MTTVLVYDGSFDGFLTAVFHTYEMRMLQPTITPEAKHHATFFDFSETILTDTEKANRVWKGLSSYCSTKGRTAIYQAFLSEQDGIEQTILHYIKRCIREKKCVRTDFSDPAILKLAKTVKKIGREKHRMEAFVRFKQTKDNVYYATVEPDFNVLPLLVKHFKRRYADQQWLIYDVSRKYGYYYDIRSVTEVWLENPPFHRTKVPDQTVYTTEEVAFERLWQNYFRSTNIKARKNNKLHQQHVPKRYWKYLSEKHKE